MSPSEAVCLTCTSPTKDRCESREAAQEFLTHLLILLADGAKEYGNWEKLTMSTNPMEVRGCAY